jgi:predicted membrane protein
MGSTVIDLRDIEVPAYGMHIEVIAIMGETSIIVSPEMHVHLSVVPIMGEAKSRAGVPFGNSNQGILEIGGVALMGSVSVRAVP